MSRVTSGKAVSAVADVPFGSRLKSLDGLRGVAVLAVVAFHTLRLQHPLGPWASVWAALQESAWAGVDLFFVLSGFLITGILLDSREGRGYFSNFYARRTLRIFPLYYATLITALLIVPALVGLRRLPALYPRLLEDQAWLWTYLANFLQARRPHTLPGFGHFWSLAVEEQFYWVWPLAVYLSSRRFLLSACIAICCLLPLVRWFLLSQGASAWSLRQITFTRIDTLLFGAVIAIAVRDPRLTAYVRRVAPVLACAAAVALLVIGFRCGYIPFEAPETLVAGYSAIGVLFAALIFHIATRDRSGVGKLLAAPAPRWLGKYSYGIYVFHWPVALALQSGIERRLIPFHSEALTATCYFTAVLAVSAALAWISWNSFEVHFLKLKRHFDYARNSAPEMRTTECAVNT